MQLSTHGLRGGFGLRGLHVQVGHHGLQALFVFCELAGKTGSVISLRTDLNTLLLTYHYVQNNTHSKLSYGTITHDQVFPCLIILKSP